MVTKGVNTTFVLFCIHFRRRDKHIIEKAKLCSIETVIRTFSVSNKGSNCYLFPLQF